MTAPKSTVKSSARVDNAKAIIAAIPRDPVTGRLMKKTPVTDEPPAAATPAVGASTGGSAPAAAPFPRGRGIHRFRRSISR